MQNNLLIIGGITDYIQSRIENDFICHSINDFATLNKAEIDAIMTNGHDGVKNEVIEQLPNLKIISCYGVGYDSIDVGFAKKQGCIVTHTPQVLNADVANTAIMLLLATSRRLVEYDQYVRENKWVENGNAPLTTSIEGKKVGLLGMGRIGQNIAKKCEAFSMDISYHARNKNPDVTYHYFPRLIDMAHHVDYLIIIAPGGEATKHLVNIEILKALGENGTVINVGRGSIIDENALVKALQNNMIKAAGLDVFENEPYISKALLAMNNVVLQPHVASGTVETRKAMGDLCVDNIIEFLNHQKAITPVPEV